MTYIVKNLGFGQLPAAKGTLYTTPAGGGTIIKTITYVNTCSSLGMDVNLFVRPSGEVSKRIIPPDLTLPARYSLVWDNVICLEPGDCIEGDSGLSNAIDFEIFGTERT